MSLFGQASEAAGAVADDDVVDLRGVAVAGRELADGGVDEFVA